MGICFDSHVKIDYLYKLALYEGEGFGTAYEYFVKINLVKKLLKGKVIKNILIAGLPEKYGFGLDFFVLAQIYRSNLFIIDDREEVLNKATKIISILQDKKLLYLKTVKYEKIDNFKGFEYKNFFDAVFSSCVIQRISKKDYLDLLFKAANSIIIFAPNNGNNAHIKFTGLSSISKAQIKSWCEYKKEHIKYKKIGLIDMPPFPPGIKNNKYLKNSENPLIKIVSIILEFWYYLELLIPAFLKNRFSHIIYLNLDNG